MAYAHQKLGELIVLHNALELGLSLLIASLAGFQGNGLAVPLINTLDFQRKCDLLRAFATLFPDQRPTLIRISKLAKDIGGKRNQAAHSMIAYGGDGPVFIPFGGARAIENKPDQPRFTVKDIRLLASKAAQLQKLVTDLKDTFDQAHRASAVQRAMKDPNSLATEVARILAAHMDGGGSRG